MWMTAMWLWLCSLVLRLATTHVQLLVCKQAPRSEAPTPRSSCSLLTRAHLSPSHSLPDSLFFSQTSRSKTLEAYSV